MKSAFAELSTSYIFDRPKIQFRRPHRNHIFQLAPSSHPDAQDVQVIYCTCTWMEYDYLSVSFTFIAHAHGWNMIILVCRLPWNNSAQTQKLKERACMKSNTQHGGSAFDVRPKRTPFTTIIIIWKKFQIGVPECGSINSSITAFRFRYHKQKLDHIQWIMTAEPGTRQLPVSRTRNTPTTSKSKKCTYDSLEKRTQ